MLRGKLFIFILVSYISNTQALPKCAEKIAQQAHTNGLRHTDLRSIEKLYTAHRYEHCKGIADASERKRFLSTIKEEWQRHIVEDLPLLYEATEKRLKMDKAEMYSNKGKNAQYRESKSKDLLSKMDIRFFGFKSLYSTAKIHHLPREKDLIKAAIKDISRKLGRERGFVPKIVSQEDSEIQSEYRNFKVVFTEPVFGVTDLVRKAKAAFLPRFSFYKKSRRANSLSHQCYSFQQKLVCDVDFKSPGHTWTTDFRNLNAEIVATPVEINYEKEILTMPTTGKKILFIVDHSSSIYDNSNDSKESYLMKALSGVLYELDRRSDETDLRINLAFTGRSDSDSLSMNDVMLFSKPSHSKTISEKISSIKAELLSTASTGKKLTPVTISEVEIESERDEGMRQIVEWIEKHSKRDYDQIIFVTDGGLMDEKGSLSADYIRDESQVIQSSTFRFLFVPIGMTSKEYFKSVPLESRDQVLSIQ